MVVTYIKWRDASYSQGDTSHADLSLIDLEEIGWLVKETEEAVTLSIERPEEGQEDYRLTLTIPKVNILLRKEIKIGRQVNAKSKGTNAGTAAQDKESPLALSN